MARLENRLLALIDEIEALRNEAWLTEQELQMHQHLDDDAQRDAVVGGPIEREDARITSSDVRRMQRLLNKLHARIDKLEKKRAALVARLG